MNRSPYAPLKPTDEYFRLVENPINKWCIHDFRERKVTNEYFSWCKDDFPELKVDAAGENTENNDVGQVFDISPQRVTHTSQASIANLSTGCSSSTEPYSCVHQYVSDIFVLAEFSDGSIQHAYAYHYDMTNIGRYFVEFEDGFILSTQNRAPYVPLKPTDEYFRLVENPINKWCIEDFPELKVNNEHLRLVDSPINNWCKDDFPELKVGAAHTSQDCNENTPQNAKLLFNNLIVLPLEDLIGPENETSMTKALSILADNLTLFSEEQADRIVELKLEFPTLGHSWSEYSRSQMQSQKFFADLEKTRNMVETSAEDEESLKIKYDELESKKKELMAQLEAVQIEQEGIAEQRLEKVKQMKHLASLAEEKARGTKEKRLVMKIASTKLNNLVDQWAAIQSFFR